MFSDPFLLTTYVALWILVATEAVALFLIFRQFGVMFMSTREGIERDGVSLGELAPDFTLPTPEGERITLSRVLERTGGALIVFGAPHCRPCHQLLPDLHRFAEEYREDFATLFISRGNADENRYFAAAFDGATTLLFDDLEGKIATHYKSRVTPFAFMVDCGGVVRAKGLANAYPQLVQMADSVPIVPAVSPNGLPLYRSPVHSVAKEA